MTWTPSVQDLITSCGYNTLTMFEKREELVDELCRYHVVDRVRTAIEMFKEGLQTLGILECMQKYPAALKKIFCNFENVLTAQDVDQIFVPQFAGLGSNRRSDQEMAVMNWRDYLQNCEGKVYIILAIFTQLRSMKFARASSLLAQSRDCIYWFCIFIIISICVTIFYLHFISL